MNTNDIRQPPTIAANAPMGSPSSVDSGNIPATRLIERARAPSVGRSPTVANTAGIDDRRAQPVGDARTDEERQRRGDDARGRRRGEDGEAEQHREPPAAPIRKRAEDRRQDRGRQGIRAGEEPDARDRLVEVRSDGRQDRRDDVVVDADREGDDRQREREIHPARVRGVACADRIGWLESSPPYHRPWERRGPGGLPGLQHRWRGARRRAVGSTPMRSRQSTEDR